MAQTDSRGTTVLGRERPELNPAGLRISGFILSPSIGVGTTFNDNIFSTQSGKKSDVVTTVSPELLFASDWNQHSLRFSGEGIVSRYANNDIEDHETFDLKADGRLDVYRDMSVTGALGYQLGSEERGSVDEAGGLTPTDQIKPRLSFPPKTGPLFLETEGGCDGSETSFRRGRTEAPARD